nr:disease resistance protein RPM1-like [Ziziphus jujuba var. spinosa]XP_024934948.2 disease resistance protein RPM1-like [Ziziphus jujuba var. spinosa]XP_024934950.2 disease resistance protein RPM1-like [Ziziphus jujuba var. spinosa]XP_024934951.2 disease resistance protein RPM1-like [Ziziphus jujuba var. spinosa]XP_048320147.1 disease resistance protein RPM1-like [Ziziphus jujuba var. spinosa]XP_048320148.1 disease resistance protein RPM1-like [Ziziphus jujuba var. spinosa]
MATAGIDILIGRILSLIENEISLYEGVHKEVEKIKHELLTMKSFLEDTKSKGAHDGEVWKTWVTNLRDMAHDVEEIVDEFNYHLSKQQSSNKFTRTLWKFVDVPKTIWVRSQIAKKLQEIKVTIRETAERHQRYGRLGSETSQVVHSEGITLHTSWVRNHAESSLFMKDDDLVGVEDVKEKLTGLLLNEDQLQRTIISVVGMGGSGKTTLVASIFSSQKVRQHFDCYAWITVSQTYTIEELLRNMIKELYTAANEEIPIDLRSMSYRQLAEILINYLQSKRYFVVLDDVWNIDLWREINVALTNGLQGSRVMLTTRKEEVATFSFGVGSQVHHVQPLGKDEAWDLFCRKAFSAKRCPPRLELLARGLVEKCKGLPLGIVTLGGVMSTKLLESEWRRVYNSFNWELSNNPMFDVLRSILLLSFNDLPYRLKHCFLYCCIFPEDYVIFRNRLIRLWIAEGFVEQIRGLTLEETAESYLIELIRRNMLQVVYSYGKPKACKMHDILRELALSISEVEKFCNVFAGQQETTEEKRARRISLHADNGQLSSFEGLAKVRTFFAFLPNMITSSSLNAFPSGFKMLKILELKRVPIHVLPYEIAYCYSLNYLNLKKTKVKELPKSITKLRHLQTLDVRESEIKVLPHGIAKLKSLRHLITYRYGERLGFKFLSFYGIKAPSSVLELKNLQVLFSVEVGDEMMIKRLRNMTQLTKLGITKVRGEYDKDMCLAIEKMKLLQSLLVMVSDVEEILRMEELSSAPPLLDELILVGKLEKIPIWFNSLGSLTSLQLRWSRLAENFLHYIQELPSLADLRLYNAYKGSSLCFLEGFQKLVRLRLFLFPELNEIIIEKGVMPHIQLLEIGRCYELKTLPYGIEHLSDLSRLNLLSVSNELIQRVRGVDRPKILHISNIDHVYDTQSGWCRERLP